MNKAGADIITISRPNDALATNWTTVFFKSQNICHNLAGMSAIGQSVDNWHRRVISHFQQGSFLESPDHYQINVTTQDACSVGNCLTMPKLQFAARKNHCFATHLAHTQIKADTSSRRGLFKNQSNHFSI